MACSLLRICWQWAVVLFGLVFSRYTQQWGEAVLILSSAFAESCIKTGGGAVIHRGVCICKQGRYSPIHGSKLH